jgi:hypothetical protein
MESFILLVMYFVTPPAPGPKNEKERVWTLQSTSQTAFNDIELCRVMGKSIINAVKPVHTLTVRAYCLCPKTTTKNNKEQCDNVPDLRTLKREEQKAFLEPLGAR